MKPEALALECIRAIQQQPSVPFIVVIGKLVAKGWPRGQCIGSDSRGRFYSYDAWKVLGCLAKYGVVGLTGIEAVDDNNGIVSIQVDGVTHQLHADGSQWRKLTERLRRAG